MYGDAKNIGNYLAKSETLLNIALPKSCYHIGNTYYCRNTANYLSGVISFDDGTLASFREGFASFVTYIIKLSDKCQSPLKVSARRRVTLLRLHAKVQHLSTSLPKLNFSNFLTDGLRNLSRQTAYIVAPSRYWENGVTMLSAGAMPPCMTSRPNSKHYKTSIVSDRPFFPRRFDRRPGSQ